MDETGSQDHAGGLNVPGDVLELGFEDNEESKAGRWSTTRSPRSSAANAYGKGSKKTLSRLKQQCTNALRAVSRKRTEISQLMIDINNLHLVKNEIARLNDLIEQYKEAFSAYYEDLIRDEGKEQERTHHEEKVNDMMVYLQPLHAWLLQAEGRMSDQLEKASSKGSLRSSEASSRLSARDKKRVPLPELKAERSMLKKKQAIRAAEEDLRFKLEIVRAEPREEVLSEIDKEHEAPLLPLDSDLPYLAVSFTPIVLKSAAAPSPNNVILSCNPCLPSTDAEILTRPAKTTVLSSLPTNPNAAEFIPRTSVGGPSSKPYTPII